MQKIILVDQLDRETGVSDKLEAHRKGLLHRAFSVFIFNANGEILLQKRASKKYHSPSLWSNTCCSHHFENKEIEECANQRLIDEMGLNCKLQYQFKFHYRVEFDNGLIENEIDYVYFGLNDGKIKPNPDEVMDWKYINPEILLQNIVDNPESYTEWFKIIIKRVILQFNQNSTDENFYLQKSTF